MAICISRDQTAEPASSFEDVTDPKISKNVEKPVPKIGASLDLENSLLPKTKPTNKVIRIIKGSIGTKTNN